MGKKRALLWLFSVALSTGAAFAQGEFRHPGLLHSEADFESIRERVAAGDEDMVAALEGLHNSPGITNPGNMGVTETIVRGAGAQNYMNAYRGASYAYQCALMWKITGETSYADRAVETLNAWRTWNKYLGGNTNVSLIPGFTGYQFANAAELMRDYRSDTWGEEEFNLFKQYLIDVWFTTAQDFLERRHDTVTREGNWYHYHSNWGLGNAMFCVAMGILCDSPDIYNYGMYWIKEGPGNESLCVTASHPDAYADGMCGYGWGLIPWFHKDSRGPLGYFNQMQESGRDQGHSMAALGLLSYALQYAYNQGDNAFCNLNNGMIAGLAGSAMVAGAAEYVAAYNSGIDDLPYRQNWWMGGLNGTGRGQARPIWQLFINHYENRMGIPMKYCHMREEALGMEMGGGSYGVNSGGYDHTGFGTLMHNDGHKVTEDEVPTLLFPQIASPTDTRNYAEISDVQPGTMLTLTAKLPEGETDTGQWEWEHGVTGENHCTIAADHSGIYRVTYTNAKGVKSTQMFSVAVRGEGWRATLTTTATYNAASFSCPDDVTEIKMGLGRTLNITTSYANWNYIEKEEWFLDGESVATGGTYTYVLRDEEKHQLVFRLTTQSGVVIERQFNISFNENELTHLLSDPDCNDVTKWDADVEGFQNQVDAVTGLTSAYLSLRHEPSQDGMDCWGLGRFNISQTLTDLQPGKYEIMVSALAAQQSLPAADSKSFVKDMYVYAGGNYVPVATQTDAADRIAVDFYVGDDGKVTFGGANMVDKNYGYSADGANWFAMDNFTLEYLGTEELEADVDTLRKMAAQVEEGTVTDEVYQTLAGLKDGTTVDVATAIALQKALSDARVIQSHYVDYKAVYTTYKEYVESEGVEDATLKAALDAFAAAGSPEEFYAAYKAMQEAWNAYIPTTKKPIDVTCMLRNAELAGSGDGVMFDAGSYWRTDAAGDNFRIFAIDGSDAQRGDAQGENMIERWTSGNFAGGVRLVYQAASGMPLGRYVFKAAAQKGSSAGVINLFANDDVTPVSEVGKLTMTEVATEVTDSVLVVGLQAGNGNGCNWTSMADVSLEYQSPLIVLEEALAEAGELDYGTDVDGALQAAMTEAQTVLATGVPEDCMEAYLKLEEAMDQYRTNNATADHPLDMTAYLINADFNMGNTAGWSMSSSDPGFPKFNLGVLEFWHASFDVSQTVTGLPTGTYRVKLQARNDMGFRNAGFYMYARTTGSEASRVYISAMTRADGSDTDLHLGQNAEDMNADLNADCVGLTVFVGDGKLTVGASCDRTDTWCVMNGFTLEYLGMTEDDLLNNWNTQVAAAKKIDRTAIPQVMGSMLDKDMAVNAASISTDSLTQALATLMNDMEQARNIMSAFAEYREQKATADTIAANSVPSMAASLTIFENNISMAETAAQQAVTPEAVQTVCSDLEKARQEYVVDAEPINGIGFDLTFKIPNASCTSANNWMNDGTWNFRSLTNAAQNGEYSGVFLENWITPNYEWKDGSRPIYQEVTELPNGNYKLTAAAFRKVELSEANDSAMNISLYLNDDRTLLTNSILNYISVEGTVTSRTAEIGLVSDSGNTANWVGLADVTLMYYGPSVIELDESDETFALDADDYGTVELTQRLYQSWWNIVCLPFDLSSTQVRRMFGDVKELESVEMDGETCRLNFEDVRSMSAGVPYLVLMDEGGSQWTFESVSLDADAIENGAVEVTDGTVTARLVGTSHVTTVQGEQVYVYDKNTFLPAGDGATVNGFRAYVEIEGAAPKQINLYVDGDLTAVQSVEADGLDGESIVDVYTLDGRLARKAVKRAEALQGLPSGLYIVGGQKVMK